MINYIIIKHKQKEYKVHLNIVSDNYKITRLHALESEKTIRVKHKTYIYCYEFPIKESKGLIKAVIRDAFHLKHYYFRSRSELINTITIY